MPLDWDALDVVVGWFLRIDVPYIRPEYVRLSSLAVLHATKQLPHLKAEDVDMMHNIPTNSKIAEIKNILKGGVDGIKTSKFDALRNLFKHDLSDDE